MSHHTQPTRIAGRYDIVRVLGQGAFGRTFLAEDRELDRKLAIKMLDSSKVADWKGLELFEREAAVLRSLRHHGVPEIYDTLRDEWDGQPAAFLLMEYVEGRSLQKLIEERHHLDPAEAIHILLELLGVLEYLHGRVPPILHRDIKPANVILRPDGFPTLVDFGAVRTALHPPGHDGSTIVGTYGYMPYEQHMGQALPASDLYALAATFLHLLTGRAPPEFINSEGRIAVPDTLPGGARLRQVLSRMLNLSPAQRYQSAREVRQALVTSDDTAVVGPGSGIVAAGSASSQGFSISGPRVRHAVSDYPPAPRRLEGDVRTRFRAIAPTTLQYMNQNAEPNGRMNRVLGGAALMFVGIVTAGILPTLAWVMASTRRSKLKRFFQNGVPAVAQIIAMNDEKTELGVKMTRVRYEWEADGRVHRDSDEVFRSRGDRWREGDQIEILYLAAHGYDSVIVEQ